MKESHSGWYVCLGCALILFCTSGLSINAFTVYQPYILKQNHFSNTQSSSLIMVRNLLSFFSMFLTSAYYSRVGYRRGLCLAGFLSSIAFLCFGLSHSFAGYCFSFALVGISYGLGTMIPITILLSQWFVQHRTLALSLCSAVTGFSTLGIPSLLTLLIETRGLSFALYLEALITALLIALSYLLIREVPQEQNTQIEETPSVLPSSSGPGLQKKDWFILVPMLLLLGAMTSVGYSHLSVCMMADGFRSDTIAIGIMFSGIALTSGKLLYGYVSERFSIRLGNRWFGIITLFGFLLIVRNGGSNLLICTGLFLYGCGLAFTTVGLAAWSSYLCTPQQYTSTVRRFQVGYAAGGLIFSPLPGILADRFHGSYHPAYIFFAFCCAFVLLSIQHLLRMHTCPAKEQNS